MEIKIIFILAILLISVPCSYAVVIDPTSTGQTSREYEILLKQTKDDILSQIIQKDANTQALVESKYQELRTEAEKTAKFYLFKVSMVIIASILFAQIATLSLLYWFNKMRFKLYGLRMKKIKEMMQNKESEKKVSG